MMSNSQQEPAQSISPEDEAFKELEQRRKLDRERSSITHKFQIGDITGYIIAGMYPDGSLGEIFVSGLGKQGSTLRGMMDAWAIAISMGLQQGISLERLANKFSNMHFDPSGFTDNPEIGKVHSVPDYIVRWLVSKFGDDNLKKEFSIKLQGVA